jgi:uncharacterized protein (TIGR03435 family)
MQKGRRALVILGIAGIAAGHPFAQAPLSFEAVSIKPRVGEPVYGTAPSAPDRYVDPDTTLRSLIRWAWELFDYELVGGPDWLDAKRWDINAKAPAAIPRNALRPLVRRMIEERFGLKAHMETRQLPIYELVMARSDKRPGPKIKPAAVDCVPFLTGQRPMQESPRNADGIPLCSSGASFSADGRLTPFLNGQPLASGLIEQLQAALQRRVVDKTGLTGNYDIELTYVDERLLAVTKRFGGNGEPGDGAAMFTALQEQLGMKLESARGPVQILVIDSVMLPSEN